MNVYATYVEARRWETYTEAQRQLVWEALTRTAALDGHTGPFQRTEAQYAHTDVDGRRWQLRRLELRPA